MGPGRLTGMNARWPRPQCSLHDGFNGARSIDRDERAENGRIPLRPIQASMGPGRLTGMNVRQARRCLQLLDRFNGARSIDRDERAVASPPAAQAARLQWGPVD